MLINRGVGYKNQFYRKSSFRKVYPYIYNPDAPWDWNILRTWMAKINGKLVIGKYSKHGACGDIDPTLPETNIAPENWWLEDDPFRLGWPMLRGYFSCKE